MANAILGHLTDGPVGCKHSWLTKGKRLSTDHVSAEKYFSRVCTLRFDNRESDQQHRHGVPHLYRPLFAIKMSENSSPDYKALFLKAEEERKRAVERERQAEERERQEAELRRQVEERERQQMERN